MCSSPKARSANIKINTSDRGLSTDAMARFTEVANRAEARRAATRAAQGKQTKRTKVAKHAQKTVFSRMFGWMIGLH